MKKSLAFIVLAFVLAACAGDSSTAPSSVVGTWGLQTVNGAALPFVVGQAGASKSELLADTIKLASGGGFIESSSFRTTFNGVVALQTIADTGTYTLSGSSLTLSSTTSAGSSGSGTVSGNTITATIQGLAFVYKR